MLLLLVDRIIVTLLKTSNKTDTVKIFPVLPFGQWSRKKGGKEYRGIRTTQFTYVRDLKGPWLLFDDRNDPYQKENLIKNKKYYAIIKHYDKLLQERLVADNDKFLTGSAYLKLYKYPPVDENGTIKYDK